MIKMIDKFMEYLSKLTKEEADFLEMACAWSNEERQAFMMAKRLFEDGSDVDRIELPESPNEVD